MLEVREYRDSDRSSLSDLLAQETVYYNNVAASSETYQQSLSNLPDGVGVLVATMDYKLVGFAAYGTLYPSLGSHTQLFLKDLFVTESHRQQGVGRALMSALMTLAIQRGCNRLDWTTDADNAGARNFYAKLGAKPVPKKLFYRLEGAELEKAAEELAKLS